MNITAIIRAWLASRERRRLTRIAEKAERERQALIRAINTRREKHIAFTHLRGDLRNATHRELAAGVGIRWER